MVFLILGHLGTVRVRARAATVCKSLKEWCSLFLVNRGPVFSYCTEGPFAH